jgi:rfaE bifunctional protein nucleotidyltransferase chain/domain/rfaE bifunctional protein kinase chain/domain
MAVTRPRLTIVGDVLLDRDLTGSVERISSDAPVPVVDVEREALRPGGAGLAACLAASEADVDVTLVTAVAEDPAGSVVVDALERQGVCVRAGRRASATPEKIRVRALGQSLLRLDRGDAGPSAVERMPGDLDHADAILVSDYGGGTTFDRVIRASISKAIHVGIPVVWDPHPRGPDPVAGCRVVTPNRKEAEAASGSETGSIAAALVSARILRDRWDAAAVAVTMGADGAVLSEAGGQYLVSPPSVDAVDVCGAGDRFASTAAIMLARGLGLRDAIEEAVADAALAVSQPWRWEEVRSALGSALGSAWRGDETTAGSRSGRPITVATSGCFDLLHAGHVRMLRAARSLGDRLVVCLNDDASVRRLKGSGRPIVPAEERAELLLALDCVDEVCTFSEDTPFQLLDLVRPDIYTKGADYRLEDIPEARQLETWGGETVILPFVEGRSTTELIARSRPLIDR